jgi:hypothetical protein
MVLDNAQILIWFAFGVIPSILASNAWVAYLRARWGGNEGVRRYLGGMYRLDHESRRPRLLETYVRPSRSPDIRPAQRRLQWTTLFLVVTAFIAWPVAGAISQGASIPDPVARSLQVALGVTCALWASRELRRPLDLRWAPTGYLVGLLIGGIGYVAFSLLAPANA